MWNHYYSDSHRTTNALEAWHGKLKASIQRPHPNIWTLIDTLKQDQVRVSVKIELAKQNKLHFAKNRCDIDKDINISLLKDLLNASTITWQDFMFQISNYAPIKHTK